MSRCRWARCRPSRGWGPAGRSASMDRRGGAEVAFDRKRIEEVAAVIAPYVRVPPVVTLSGADFGLAPFSLTLKLELLQHSGAFKARGAFANLLLRPLPASVSPPPPAVTTASRSPTRRCALG